MPDRKPKRTDGCPSFEMASRFSRRSALRLGGLFGVNLSLASLLQQQASAVGSTRTFGKAKRVIMLFLHGGHPQQETFDPKPNGPSAVKGEFGAIPTNVSGVQFSEMLPACAQLMNRFSIIRSMSHDNPNHVTACLPAQTGHKHPPGTPMTDFPPAPSDFPPVGAVLSHLRGSETKLPSWFRIGPLMRRSNGTTLHGQLPGFLGAKNDHFAVDQKLLGDDVKVEAVQPTIDLSTDRLGSRRDLLREFDKQRAILDREASARNLDEFYQKAFGLLASPATQAAFNVAAESPGMRDRYGKTEFGQRCLLARRLSEAGVPMVNVSYCHTPSGSWDTHSNNFNKLKTSLAPTLDAAVHGLVTDLEERGLLDETLVVVNAEFGRTPKINSRSGRDHWPWVYSLVLAGAGTRPGTIFGASDKSAAYPAESPRTQGDFLATLYHLLGVDPKTVLRDQLGRPHHLIAGSVINELLT